MIQRLERHAGGQGAVADHGHDAPAVAELRRGDCHAQRGADRGARMTDAEGVVFALGRGSETAPDPPGCLMVGSRSRRPVSTLCG